MKVQYLQSETMTSNNVIAPHQKRGGIIMHFINVIFSISHLSSEKSKNKPLRKNIVYLLRYSLRDMF